MKTRIFAWISCLYGLGAIAVYIAGLVDRMNTISGSVIGGADWPTFLYILQSGPSLLAIAGVALLVLGTVLLVKKK